MQEEIKSLHENQTWKLVTVPPGIKTVRCKWAFKVKPKVDSNSNGEIQGLIGSKGLFTGLELIILKHTPLLQSLIA
jgi:hypothetical protein